MKSLIKIMLMVSTLIFSPLFSVEPYDSMRQLTYQPYFLQDGYILYNKVAAQAPTIFVDVGSVDGAASRYIAANTDSSVKIYCINPWSEGEQSFNQFISNVVQENKSEQIIPLRMTSKEASNALNITAGLVFIEGSDSSVVYDNILSWVALLSDNGKICGNHWELPSLELAVVEAAVHLNLGLTVNGTYWFLEKL